MQITLNLINGLGTRFATSIGYTAKIIVDGVEVDNPDTKEQFCKKWLKSLIKNQVLATEAETARKVASETKMAEEFEIT
ncbi:MAG: hypothetical protein WC679_14025 [Bacteroidales bacterium]|jgi:hypothetical protein